MRHQPPTLSLLLLSSISLVFAALLFYPTHSVTSQTPNKNLNANSGHPGRKAIQFPPRPTPTPESDAEVVKVDVDLVKVDALVLKKKTAIAVNGLKKEDFLIYEDGAKQEITHFSQDKLPLSVILVIDRGECIDPYRDEVHSAAREAIDRLKLVAEIAVMAYANTSVMIQPFTTNRIMLENSLQRIPPQAGNVEHCLNNMFANAANYMIKASNPAGRRVVIVITGVTRLFDCSGNPSGRSATLAIYESGSVVCGIIPKVPTQGIENGMMTMATRVFKIGGADYMDIQTLANETGGEVMADKLETLDTTFQTLIEHLRSRYNLGFVSTNKKRDGTTRKLKLDLAPSIEKSQGKLVIKARRSYVAPRN